MSEPDFDVVVVGAGPAGANAAYHAAKNGARVCLLEAAPVIGEPIVCAEGVVSKVLEDFDLPKQGEHIATKVTRVKMWTPKGKVIDLKLKRLCGYILNRDKLEKMLVQRAVKAGAVLRLNHKVAGFAITGAAEGAVVVDGKGVITGEIVIAADGHESVVARDAGLTSPLEKKDIGACVQKTMGDVECADDTIEIYWNDKSSPGGYTWLFPKGKGVANIGLGVIASKGEPIGKNLDEFIERRCPNAKQLRHVGGLVPLAMPLERATTAQVIAVGDAARYVFALTGAGIGAALMSGKEAGEIAAGATIGDGFVQTSDYDRHMEPLKTKLRRSYQLKEKLITDPMRSERYFALARMVVGLHKLAPGPVERRAFSSARY